MAGIGVNSLGAIQNPGSPSGRLEGFPVQGAFSWQPIPAANLGLDRGLLLSLRRQLAAMLGDPSCLLGSLPPCFCFPWFLDFSGCTAARIPVVGLGRSEALRRPEGGALRAKRRSRPTTGDVSAGLGTPRLSRFRSA